MFEKAKNYLISKGVDEKDIYKFQESSATVELAAQAIGCEGSHIAKSMSFEASDGCIIVVTAGDVKIDNSKFKAFFGCKAKMVSPDMLVERIGYPMGGVCPFAVNDGVKVYLEESLKRFEIVYPACGSTDSAVKLTPERLYDLAQAQEWVDVCKPKEMQI